MTQPAPTAKSTRSYMPILALLLLLGLGTLWGGQTVLARFVAVSGVPAFGYAFWQMFGAGIILLIVNYRRGRGLPLTRETIRYYIIMGWVGSAIPTANMYIALAEIPAGVNALVIATVPMLTYVFAVGVRTEQFDFRRALGIAIGMGGVAVMLVPEGSLPEPGMITFVLIAFITPFLYAGTTIYAARHKPPDADPLQMACGMMLASSLLLLPVSLATGNFHPLWVNFGLREGLMIVHSCTTALTFSLYFIILTKAGPVYISQVAYIVTASAIGWGMLVLGERHSPWIWVAVALIVGGVALVNSRQRALAGK